MVVVKLSRYTKQGSRAFEIYKACGPGPFLVVDAERALGKKRIGPIMGSLREDKIAVHHSDGSQMPMVRRKGEERTPPEWYFTSWAVQKFEQWIAEDSQSDGVKA